LRLIGVPATFVLFGLMKLEKIIERRLFPSAVLRVEEGRFAETLLAQVGDWLTAGESRILLCGMVGSREGWAEAKYLRCPIGIADLADSVIKLPFARAQKGFWFQV